MKLPSAVQYVAELPARTLVLLVRVYQLTLSPIMGRQCRFVPTCSNYFIEAVRKRGALRGSLMGLWRICRCNPFSRGGYDPVEARETPDARCTTLDDNSAPA